MLNSREERYKQKAAFWKNLKPLRHIIEKQFRSCFELFV